MILDTLNNFSKYTKLHPLFPLVADYLKKHNLATHELGTEIIIEEQLLVNYSVAKGKAREKARIETHNLMIDIQIPISIAETMGFSPRENLPAADYDPDKDISFYEGAPEQYITVHPGEFVVFFPQDGHAPCITETEEIVKVIFKIKA